MQMTTMMQMTTEVIPITKPSRAVDLFFIQFFFFFHTLTTLFRINDTIYNMI